MMAFITEEVRALIGAESDPLTCPWPLERDTLRRFVQAVMESNPIHWSDEVAAQTRYGELVAVPLFPAHVHQRPTGTVDPFDIFDSSPADDGTFDAAGWSGLPPVNVPLRRVVNGGTEAEFFQLAKIGDIITSRSSYADIRERVGKSGPMIIIKVRTTYTNQFGDLLAIITITPILR
jgi:acyl dehydratase